MEKIHTLDDSLKLFFTQLSKIKTYESTLRSNTDKILYDLYTKKKSIDTINKLPDTDDFIKNNNGVIARTFSFKNPYLEEPYIYSGSVIDINESIELTYIHLNKQYQSILVDAYEYFEDFIEIIYGCAGYIDNNFWIASDYGNISIGELDSKPLNWFIHQSEKKKKAPMSILQRFRENLNNLNTIEVNNRININFRLFITMIEMFRHIIVHNNGIIKNKNEFISNILKKSNIPKKEEDTNKNIIFSFISKYKNEEYINLIDRDVVRNHSFKVFKNIIGEILEILLQYAYILRCELHSHFNLK
ncbi:TPA: hypothetical protein ACXIBI_002042 [Proteus mirabilis]